MLPLLLLAQLVLPSPPSGPIQPPGMICASGDCSGGPVVYRTSQRGRLVVACDMRSDTCSDGRQITTTRATPVPCETSPGVWQTIPEDTGCYSVRGLEPWAQNTSYLSWGAELDREPWRASARGGSLEPIADGWRVHNNPDVGSSGWIQQVDEWGLDETRTAACIVRSIHGVTVQIGSHGAPNEVPEIVLPGSPEWVTISSTQTRAQGTIGYLTIYPGGRTVGAASIDVKACWLTKTSTPGRPCWGGEAPVTCAADQHTISTEGWPTEAGEVEIVFNYGQVIGRPERLIDGRSTEDPQHFTLFISSLSGNPLTLSLNATPIVQSSSLSWEEGKVYRVRMRRTLDGEIELFRDGVSVAAASGPPLSWGPRAVLGGRFDIQQQLNGSISSLRVRSTP